MFRLAVTINCFFRFGLRYVVHEQGNGNRPSLGNTLMVAYTGTLLDGTQFDSSIGSPIGSDEILIFEVELLNFY